MQLQNLCTRVVRERRRLQVLRHGLRRFKVREDNGRKPMPYPEYGR